MASKAKAADAKPFLRCPYTGEPLEVVHVANGAVGRLGVSSWLARGKFYSTSLFKSKRELLWWLSHRDGKPPAFSREEPELAVTKLERPQSNPAEGLTGSGDVVEQVAEVLGRTGG